LASQPVRHRRGERGRARRVQRLCAAPGGGAGGAAGIGVHCGCRGVCSSGGVAMTDPVVPGVPEFTRPVDVGRLPSGEAAYSLEATPAERAALGRRFDLLALDRLQAEVRLQRLAGGLLRLSLALDPYPRAPGAIAEAPAERRVSPFAALARWKENN